MKILYQMLLIGQVLTIFRDVFKAHDSAVLTVGERPCGSGLAYALLAAGTVSVKDIRVDATTEQNQRKIDRGSLQFLEIGDEIMVHRSGEAVALNLQNELDLVKRLPVSRVQVVHEHSM